LYGNLRWNTSIFGVWEEINEAVIQQQHRVCYLFFSLFLRLPLCVCYVTSHGRSGEGIYSTASTRAVTTQRERGGLDAFQCSAVGTHSHAHAIFPCHTYSRVGIRFFFFLIFCCCCCGTRRKIPKVWSSGPDGPATSSDSPG
jgi:hypothetical protein